MRLAEPSFSSEAYRTESLLIRPIEPRDNPQLTQLISAVWGEFDSRTVYFDDPSIPAGIALPEESSQQSDDSLLNPEAMSLSQRYQNPAGQPVDRGYWVIEDLTSQRLLGGGGFAALIGPEADVCELQKLYLLPELRGLGMGSRLLSMILTQAAQAGYHEIYLESIPEMAGAVNLYEKFGFRHCPRKGTTGHWRCEIFMSRLLLPPAETDQALTPVTSASLR
jgi:putative acetyltransferase